MSVNKLHFQATMDGTGFSRGLNTLNNSVGTFKNALVGAFGTFAVGSLIKGTIDWAGKLQDSADALGVNVEFLQKLQNGAKATGGTIEDVTRFMQEMNKSRMDAMQNPEGKNSKALGRLGISGSDVGGLSTEDAMRKIMESLNNGLTTEGAADLQEVGGRSARRLAAAFANQFASDAPILSAAMIEQLDAIGDRFTEFKTMLMVSLAPAIIWCITKLRELINWIKQLGSAAGANAGDPVEARRKRMENSQVIYKRAENLLKTDPTLSAEEKAKLKSIMAEQKSIAEDTFVDPGGMAATEEQKRQEREQSAAEKAMAAAAAARKAREKSGINFEPLLKVKKESETKAPYSDALLGVGNFLGAGSNMVNSIADQQLSEARTTNQKLDDANTRLDKIADKLGDAGDGIEVP